MDIDLRSLLDIAQYAAVALLTAAVLKLLASQQRKPDNALLPGRLQHPVAVLALGAVCSLFFSALAVASIVFDNGTGGWGVASFFIAFALVGSLFILEYVRVRHECTNNGITYAKLFGSGGYLQWKDISSIRYSESMKWFRIESSSGEVIRISAMLKGLPQFADLVLRNVHAPAIDENSRVVLVETADGNPPSFW